PEREVAAGGQGVGVAGAQHPHLVGQQFLGQAQRLRRIPAQASPVRDVAAGVQAVGVVGGLDVAAQGEVGGAVGERLVVAAGRGGAVGEGVVQAQQVVVGVFGGAGEFVVEQDNLQAGIGVGAADGAQDRGRCVPLCGGPGVDHGGEQPLGQGGVTGLAGVEG